MEETITLEDAVTGEQFQIQLSSQDAVRARLDISYATALLKSAQSTAKVSKDKEQPENDDNVDETPGCSSGTDVAMELEHFKWQHPAVLLLCEEYRNRASDLSSGKISQKKVWEGIAKSMAKIGHDVTGPQCLLKFSGMKRTFKKIKDHNNKSGNNPRSWPYLELLESLLDDKPFMNPVATASSSTPTGSVCQNGSSVASSCNTPHVGRKRKSEQSDAAAILKAIQESREMAETNKERRHQQNSEQRKELLNKLDRILEKM